MSLQLVDFVEGVCRHVAATDALYAANHVPDLPTHPIPFFGDPLTARVITVGVNPSASEFKHRQWPAHLCPLQLTERLTAYFQLDAPAPHPWFQPWQEALKALGVSYQNGAAHLDLSPRATISMGKVPNLELFLEMVKADLPSFLSLLRQCRSARLILAAGTVTKRYYLAMFLAKHGAHLDYCLTPAPTRADRATLHRLGAPGLDLPLFFSSVSPSAGTRSSILVHNICANRERLLPLLN